jgi:hypothetical protein
MPIILAIWEAEIRMILVQGQSQKLTKGVAYAVEHLFCKGKALNSNPSPPKKKKKKKPKT